MGLSAGVLGASGYTGAEVLRYLSGHPAVAVEVVGGARSAGASLRAVHPHLPGPDLTIVPLDEATGTEVDVLFSCLPAGELGARPVAARCLVDLSDDHRSDPAWAYGLTEYVRAGVKDSARVANPGCYPTAALLAVLPFARAGVIGGPVVVDALSGTSGAGRKPLDHLLATNVTGGVAAYGTVAHRHVPEMERGLQQWGGLDTIVSFTPHLVPIARGLVATVRAPVKESIDDRSALGILEDAYTEESFVSVTHEWPHTKSVAGTNRVLVTAKVDARAGLLVCQAAIDNLGKGAAGQAIQNANLMLGLDETAGLDVAVVWP